MNPSPARVARPLRLAAAGLLTGAAFGAAETALRTFGISEPSVVRRTGPLLLYGGLLYAALFAVLFLFAGIFARFGASRGWPSAAGSPRPLLAGFAAGAVTECLLVSLAGSWFWKAPVPIGPGLLLLCTTLAVVSGWWTARRCSRGSGGRVERALGVLLHLRRLVLVAVAVLACALLWGALRHPALAGDSPGAGKIPAERRPNILLILCDTLRADALGCYGGPKGLTPNLDRLASRGVLFEEAAAPSPWTLPSVVSVWTSLYPREHGLVEFDGVVQGEVETLAERLSKAGYDCQAFVGNPLMTASRGFARGFRFYDVYDYHVESRLFASRSFAGALRLSGLLGAVQQEKSPILWLDLSRPPFLTTILSFYVQDEVLNERLSRYASFARERPFFLFVHYVAPHSPYLRHPYGFLKSQPAKTAANLGMLRSLYEGEVAYMDGVAQELLAQLDKDGLLDNTVVVFVSDHGEEFLEHGKWEHGHSLYQEVLRVPLILAGPGLPQGGRVRQRVELLDIAPTLLELAGASVPPSFSGRSLVPLLRGEEERYAPRPIFSELTSRYLDPKADYTSVIGEKWKVIRRRDPSGRLLSEEVYDLAADPSEKGPLVPPPDATAPLKARLDAFERMSFRKTGAALSEEEMRKLRSLGYVK